MTNRANDEAPIRERLDFYVAAIREQDLENVVAIFAPDLVSFDLDPPLKHVGVEAKRQNWERGFAAYEHPIGYEITDLVLTLGEDVGFGRSLNHIWGRLKAGGTTDTWFRWTIGLRRIDGTWFIVHDHVSPPIDLKTGKALLDLKP